MAIKRNFVSIYFRCGPYHFLISFNLLKKIKRRLGKCTGSPNITTRKGEMIRIKSTYRHMFLECVCQQISKSPQSFVLKCRRYGSIRVQTEGFKQEEIKVFGAGIW